MMGERRFRQDALFYEFSFEDHVPAGHLLRSIDRFVELNGLRREMMASYSEKGRPSIDPELLIGIVGYCFGICWERRLCEVSSDLSGCVAARPHPLAAQIREDRIDTCGLLDWTRRH